MKSLFKKIFSFEINNNHKIYKVLGIKFSFRHNNNFILLYKQNGKVIKNPKIKGLRVNFYGKNAVVKLHEPYNFSNCVIDLSENAFVEIEGTNYAYRNLFVNASCLMNYELRIGKNSSCGGLTICSVVGYGVKVSIGEECAFSTDVLIQSHDGHQLIDKKTNEIVNQRIDGIRIGNHCWVGRHAKISKNVSLPNNTIVEMGAIVTKSFEEENLVLAGVPAQIIKKDIDWKR